MAIEEAGQLGIILLRHGEQAIAVACHLTPAAGDAALGDALGDRAAVAHVILGDHDEAVVGEDLRQALIAGGVLRDAVDDLDEAAGLARRLPLAAVDLGIVSYGKGKFFHRRSPFCPFYRTSYIL